MGVTVETFESLVAEESDLLNFVTVLVEDT
jgi:hypothetical protein